MQEVIDQCYCCVNDATKRSSCNAKNFQGIMDYVGLGGLQVEQGLSCGADSSKVSRHQGPVASSEFLADWWQNQQNCMEELIKGKRKL